MYSSIRNIFLCYISKRVLSKIILSILINTVVHKMLIMSKTIINNLITQTQQSKLCSNHSGFFFQHRFSNSTRLPQTFLVRNESFLSPSTSHTTCTDNRDHQVSFWNKPRTACLCSLSSCTHARLA